MASILIIYTVVTYGIAISAAGGLIMDSIREQRRAEMLLIMGSIVLAPLTIPILLSIIGAALWDDRRRQIKNHIIESDENYTADTGEYMSGRIDRLTYIIRTGHPPSKNAENYRRVFDRRWNWFTCQVGKLAEKVRDI